MKCTECGGKTKVLESGLWEEGFHRRRKCLNCGKEFYTSESISPKAKFSLRVAKSIARGVME